ncbi:hypothetical protein L596_007846 [Steinernema carpocapsae]|uniref:ABC transporter TMD0 domain-containing protein n=1 Tax=Steinernema carpocapsae TaxID=34508 RepID=A0A4U5PAT5_STECR|nr:hypothetical protein L596_007846 [Steinernema carpocapsae]
MFDVQSILCDRPNQGECIQHSYLVAVPTTALFLLSPLLIYKLRQSKNGSLSPNSPISLRIVLNVVQCIVVASLFVYGIYEHLNDRDRSRVELIYPLPLCLSLFLALVLQVACQRFGIITSGVLFIYWLLLAVCGVPEFRKVLEVAGNDILNHPNRFLFGVNYVLVCIQLFLSCFADKLRDHSHSVGQL